MKPAKKTTRNSYFRVTEPCSLQAFLLERLHGISRNSVKSLLTHHQVKVNNAPVTNPTCALNAGDEVVVLHGWVEKPFSSPLLQIVYEDEYLLVVNKHEGLLTIATDRERSRTAYSILKQYIKRNDPSNKLFIVHRLDKDTSGLLLFAKSEEIKNAFQHNWLRVIEDRKYVAVVSGEMEQDEGEIVSWLKENAAYVTYSSKKEGDGQKAVTHYKVLSRKNNHTLVELKLETGRKNQIRVHLSDIHHPICGDKKYGSKENPLHRLALHAYKISFRHPATGKLVVLETSIPDKFKKIVS